MSKGRGSSDPRGSQVAVVVGREAENTEVGNPLLGSFSAPR